MPTPRALKRLLEVREREEEQHRLAARSAASDLEQLRRAKMMAHERGERGRALVTASVRSGMLSDRLAGLEEVRAGSQMEAILARRVVAAELRVAELQSTLRKAQIERRQAEIVLERIEDRNAVDARRRAQQGLDEWHQSKGRRK